MRPKHEFVVRPKKVSGRPPSIPRNPRARTTLAIRPMAYQKKAIHEFAALKNMDITEWAVGLMLQDMERRRGEE